VLDYARHEDERVSSCPSRSAADELDGEHRALDVAQAEVARAADALALLDLAGRPAGAARLVCVVNHLIAMQLLHMNREETEVNRVLWARLDDAALAAVRTRLVATIPAPRYAEWLELVRVATNPVERQRAGSTRVG
jgi:hypothetical protein